MKARPPRTLLEVCVARSSAGDASMVGQLRAIPKGMRVCEYIALWAIALDDGCDPEVRAVAAWWREAEATFYRRNREFRELFEGEPNPERVARVLLATKRGGEKPAPAALMALPVAV